MSGAQAANFSRTTTSGGVLAAGSRSAIRRCRSTPPFRKALWPYKSATMLRQAHIR